MSCPGTPRSPFQEGFAALREEPLLLAGELTWRGCFAFAAWTLALFAAALFLDSITVSNVDRLKLPTMQPMLAWSALAHTFHGTLLRYVWVKSLVLAGTTLLWCFAAAAGRTVSLQRLVAMFRGDDQLESDVPGVSDWQFGSVFALHLARGAWAWIAIGCVIGSVMLGVALSHQQRAMRAAFFFVFGFVLSALFGLVLNWFLGLAPLFAVREQTDPGHAISLCLDFCARRSRSLLLLTLAFWALRLFWASAMFLIVLSPLNLASKIAVGWVLLLMAMLALIYFAGADALQLAQRGAYAALAEKDARPQPMPEVPPEPATPLSVIGEIPNAEPA